MVWLSSTEKSFEHAEDVMRRFEERFLDFRFGPKGKAVAVSVACAVAGVIVLRRREPDLPRPYLCPLYPVR